MRALPGPEFLWIHKPIRVSKRGLQYEPIRTGYTVTPANTRLALHPDSLKPEAHVDQMIPIPSARCRATLRTKTEYSTMLLRGRLLGAALVYS